MVNDIQKTGLQNVAPPASRSRKWLPPRLEILKLNVDGAFKQEAKSGA